MNVTLRQLRVFESIARRKSLTDAAGEQAISQSAASQSLKELEKQLGYALFRKVGRQLTLTESGQLALPKIRQVLASLESLRFPEAKFIGGSLKVSASETIASYLMPKLLADFVAAFPHVEPVLSIRNTEGVVQDIEQGQASIGFIEGPTDSRQITLTPWREDRLTVFAGPDFRWSADGEVPDSELAALPWIVREQGSGTRAVFDSAFERRQQIPRIQLALSRQEAIKQSARSGLGVGCLSELAIADEVVAGHLIALKTDLRLVRSFSMVQLKTDAPTPLIAKFQKFALQWPPHSPIHESAISD